MATSEKGEMPNNKEYRLTQTDLELLNFAVEVKKHRKALQAGIPENSVLITGEHPFAPDLENITRLAAMVVHIEAIGRNYTLNGTYQTETEAINSLLSKRMDENLSLEELISMRDTLKKEMEAVKNTS